MEICLTWLPQKRTLPRVAHADPIPCFARCPVAVLLKNGIKEGRTDTKEEISIRWADVDMGKRKPRRTRRYLTGSVVIHRSFFFFFFFAFLVIALFRSGMFEEVASTFLVDSAQDARNIFRAQESSPRRVPVSDT